MEYAVEFPYQMSEHISAHARAGSDDLAHPGDALSRRPGDEAASTTAGGFDQLFGARRGVARQSPDESRAAARRDHVDTEVDSFLRIHRDHASAFFFRSHIELPEAPGSLNCLACNVAVLAPTIELAVAVRRAGVTVEGASLREFR